MTRKHKTVVLMVLDGWGVAPPAKGNAVLQAKTPVFDGLLSAYPYTTVQAAGEAVGLPWQEMGNSEVGHMNIGSGRIMYQDLPMINKFILDGTFFTNEAFLGALEHAQHYKSDLHLIGLVSPGGVHSHIDHLLALLKLLSKKKFKQNIYIHVITDGRDVGYNTAPDFIKELNKRIKMFRVGKIATVAGRHWPMDRDDRWERVEKAYRTMVFGEGPTFKNVETAIKNSYNQKIYDEEIVPSVIVEGGKPVGLVKDNDAVIFFNYRSDRAKELTKAFVLPSFDKFNRGKTLSNLFFVTLREYDRDLPVKIAFPSEEVFNSLGEVLSRENLRQLRLAETEKYAHVTVFFNCGKIDPFPNEERRIVSSPAVVSYDLKPEMGAYEITDILVKSIQEQKYDFIMVNFANPDMVGHTGSVVSTVKAVEAVDECLGKVTKAIAATGSIGVIVADHGNAEVKVNLQTGEMSKEHTANPVPFIVIDEAKRRVGKVDRDLSLVQPIGVLADVAPTILELLEVKKPIEMMGISLLKML